MRNNKNNKNNKIGEERNITTNLIIHWKLDPAPWWSSGALGVAAFGVVIK
jgi:hypothetical protein